jgi:hypothetical protein
MQLPFILALAENAGCSAFDQMLRFFGIAAIVWAFFNGLKSLISKPPAPQPPVAAPLAARSPQPALATTAGPEAIAPETIAVITAAVATTTGSCRRIVAIKQQASHWAKAGRQAVLTSHKIR